MIYDLIIIGSGPSGLFAGANIKNKKVLILEKNQEPGKKLLVSGSGQCNFTNKEDIDKFITHYGNKTNYVKKILFRFTNEQTIQYFKKLGMDFYVDKNNKCFPKSLKAKDVLNILLKEIDNNNHSIKYSEKVLKIKKVENFEINTENNTYLSKRILIATGGASYPHLGTSGDGYVFAKKFNHNIISPKPALTSIKIKNFDMEHLAGTSFHNAKIKLSGEKIQYSNDLLITHFGFSGPCILDFSRYLEANQKITISYLNFRNKDHFKNDLYKKISKSNNNLFSILKEYGLTRKFIEYLQRKININPRLSSSNINKNTRMKIIDFLIDKEYTIKELNNFDNAMVTSGGIDIKEINAKNMESKIQKNLFFSGEVIDIDGDTGGYNIQFALSSGWIIAEYLNNIL